MLSLLTQWATSNRAFKRNREQVEKKVLAAALCNAGYSYREVASMLGGISYVAVRDCFVAMTTSFPQTTRKPRGEVAIDGSEARVDGRPFYVWLARDAQSGEVLSFHASPTGSAEDGARFLASVGALCENRPRARIDSADQPRGLLNLDLYFQQHEPPSLMDRIGKLILGVGQRPQWS